MENTKPVNDLEFRTIPSLNHKYEINSNGTVLRNSITKKPISIRLDMHHSKTGYYAAFICYNGKVRRLMIHKLVAECWLGEKPDNMEIDHIDRNSRNNEYTNLRYVNHIEQMKNRVLSDKIISQAKLNCKSWVENQVSRPIMIITPENKRMIFQSHTACSKYLGDKFQQSFESIRDTYLKQQKESVKNYKIIYLDREPDRSIMITNMTTGQIYITGWTILAAHYISNFTNLSIDDVHHQLLNFECDIDVFKIHYI